MVTDEELKDDLRKLEQSLWIAETRFDSDYLEQILAPDFFEFGRSGRLHSRQDIMSVPAEEIKATLPLKDFEIHQISRDVYLVTYISEVKYGKTEIGIRSSLWSNASGRWQIHFHQGTPVTAPEETGD